MSGTFQVAPRAQADFDEILLYIAADRPHARDRILSRFEPTFDLLASQPGVEILRVLHDARDLGATTIF